MYAYPPEIETTEPPLHIENNLLEDRRFLVYVAINNNGASLQDIHAFNVPADAFPEELLVLVLKRRSIVMGDLDLENQADCVLKIVGQESYLLGNYSLLQYTVGSPLWLEKVATCITGVWGFISFHFFKALFFIIYASASLFLFKVAICVSRYVELKEIVPYLLGHDSSLKLMMWPAYTYLYTFFIFTCTCNKQQVTTYFQTLSSQLLFVKSFSDDYMWSLGT